MKALFKPTVFFLCLLLTTTGIGCGKDKAPAKAEDCLAQIPESVDGLRIEGERPEKNIIVNMVPFICGIQDLYQKRLAEKPELKGSLELKILVEFNGEIISYAIDRVTIDDTVLVKEIKHRLGFLDFDPYGRFNTETEFTYPVRFGN